MNFNLPPNAPWGAIFLLAIGMMVGTVLKTFLQQQPRFRQVVNEGDGALRGELMRRVEKLEKDLTDQAANFTAQLTQERVEHEAEISVMRHRLNNVTQEFEALLMLIKANPDKAAEAVAMIEEMRATHLIAEATEKASLKGAKVKAAGITIATGDK